jgi:hypothetical protein
MRGKGVPEKFIACDHGAKWLSLEKNDSIVRQSAFFLVINKDLSERCGGCGAPGISETHPIQVLHPFYSLRIL